MSSLHKLAESVFQESFCLPMVAWRKHAVVPENVYDKELRTALDSSHSNNLSPTITRN